MFYSSPEDAPRIVEDEISLKKKRMEKKKMLKEKFNNDYDDGGGDRAYQEELKREVDHQTMVSFDADHT